MLRRGAILVAAAAVLMSGSSVVQAQPRLDYEQFKASVQPIFVTKRPGYSRCIVCHGGANNALSLPRLSPGVATFTEEQSRKNFEIVSNLVVPGKPDESRLLMYPLVAEEGGSAYHSGGRQWPTKTDPAWQTIARWVNGQK
jgi:hypothetical protein